LLQLQGSLRSRIYIKILQKKRALLNNIFAVVNGYAFIADNVTRAFEPKLVPLMKQQEVILLLLIIRNAAETTTMSWSNAKVFMS